MTDTPISRAGPRLTGVERERTAHALADSYRRGRSIRLIGLDTGYSFGFVRGLLLEVGTALRPRGGNQRPASGRSGTEARR